MVLPSTVLPPPLTAVGRRCVDATDGCRVALAGVLLVDAMPGLPAVAGVAVALGGGTFLANVPADRGRSWGVGDRDDSGRLRRGVTKGRSGRGFAPVAAVAVTAVAPECEATTSADVACGDAVGSVVSLSLGLATKPDAAALARTSCCRACSCSCRFCGRGPRQDSNRKQRSCR